MNLYHVQDADRPMWVYASDYSSAVFKWKALIAEENDEMIGEVVDPQGVSFICEEIDLIR